VERHVGPLEQAALGLAEAKDRTSRVESDVTSLRAAMADNSEKVEEVRPEVAGLKAQFSDYCPKVNQDSANLERELATLKEEMRATKPKAEPLAPPTADVTVPAAPASSAPAKPAPKLAPVKVSPPPAPPKRGKQFPPSVKKGGQFEVPDRIRIIAHLTRECGGNVQDRRIVDVTSACFENETYGANPSYSEENATDLGADLYFQ
jgi:hypothetical protein